MAGTVLANDIADLVKGTRRNEGRLKVQQIAQELPEYPVMEHWLRRDRTTIEGGRGIQRNLMTKTSGQAAFVGAYDEDSYDIPDLLQQMTVDYVHCQVPYGFEYKTDILQNRNDPEKIVDLIQTRRISALIELAELLESRAAQVPTTSESTLPYGLPYWLVYNSTTGFTGGVPSGHTTVAGIDPDVHTKFKNYSANYTNVTKDDLIKKMRTAKSKIRWRSPTKVADYTKGKAGQLIIYTNEQQTRAFEDLGEGQNENLGKDVAPYVAGKPHDLKQTELGAILFRGHSICEWNQLDDTAVYTASTNPVFMVDHSVFHTVVLKGDYLRESDAEKVPGKHDMFRSFINLSLNWICVDRRRCAHLATA